MAYLWLGSLNSHMSQSPHSSPPFFLRLCDYLTIGGVCLLLFLSPLAFGTVHQWAYGLMEMVVFLLVMVWMGKLWGLSQQLPLQERRKEAARSPAVRSLFFPLILFTGLCTAQLVPVPPVIVSYLSPATYALYQQNLPGWPEQNPYAEWLKEEPAAESSSIAKETQQKDDGTDDPSEVDSDLSPPVASGVADTCAHCTDEAGAWMPLSLAPALTQITLLKFLAYVSFFFLVLLYPVDITQGRDGERQFPRALCVTIVSTGFLIATLAILQRYFWNGKILWFFVPDHWDEAKADLIPRASGPFVNSDHFANYLVLVIPLLLGGLLSPTLFVGQRKQKAFAIFCGAALIVALTGLLLSLSRGGWLGAGIGMGIFLWFVCTLPPERRPQILPWLKGVRLYGLVAFSIIAGVFGLLRLDDAGLNQIDQRIDATLNFANGLDVRMKVWQGSLAMIRDFPLFGVGLGAWAELFPRYQLPPWSPLQWHEAHNDYLQCLAETGGIGLGLLGWFFCMVMLRIRRGLSTVDSSHTPVLVGILAALGGMAFHTGVDFNLQIPANALLFTALVALGLRLCRTGADVEHLTPSFFPRPLLRIGVGMLALCLCAVAMKQREVPYRNDPDSFTSVSEARANIFSFPARRDGHLALIDLQEGLVPAPEVRKELEIAVKMAPLDPEVRDQYIVALLEGGHHEVALRQLQQSVFNSPLLDTHFYLAPEAIASLDPQEIQAIEKGMLQAVATNLYGAADGLGGFYRLLKRDAEAGKIYEEAGLKEPRGYMRGQYLFEAGRAYVQNGESERAEPLLREAIAHIPRTPTLYRTLAIDVLAARHDFAAATAVIAEGARRGVALASVLFSLADTVKRTGDSSAAIAILEDALSYMPRSHDVHLRIGKMHLDERNFDRAVLSLKKSIQAQPNVALAFYLLGRAEEGRYHYQEAQEAYAQAVKFAPNDATYQQRYEMLRQKSAVKKTSNSLPLRR